MKQILPHETKNQLSSLFKNLKKSSFVEKIDVDEHKDYNSLKINSEDDDFSDFQEYMDSEYKKTELDFDLKIGEEGL